jgi:hypothetical protein
MTNSAKDGGRISRIRLRTVTATPAFASVLLLLVVASQSARTQTFSVLYTFTGGTDGGVPYSGLVRDNIGNLYGTAFLGGDLACNDGGQIPGCGTVFKVTKRRQVYCALQLHGPAGRRISRRGFGS